MSKPPKSTVWPADPHTIAKVEIVKRYSNVWAMILAQSPKFAGQPLTFIDGFAGPGRYTNYDQGSPIAAISGLTAALQKLGDRWKAGDVRCMFIEQKRARHAFLEQLLQERGADTNIIVRTHCSSFEDGVAEVRKHFGDAFLTHAPLLAFIDPFGVKGVAFDKVAEILKSPCSEVIINFNVKGVDRIFRAGDASKAEEVLGTIFGGVKWRERFRPDMTQRQLCQEAVALYMERLEGLPAVNWTFPFEMSSQQGSIDYFLVFASKSQRGLEAMKECMEAITKDGTFGFCDAHDGQGRLWKMNDPKDVAPIVQNAFRSRRAPPNEVIRYILTKTEGRLWKGVLKVLEQNYGMEVRMRGGIVRKAGTFAVISDVVSLIFQS